MCVGNVSLTARVDGADCRVPEARCCEDQAVADNNRRYDAFAGARSRPDSPAGCQIKTLYDVAG